MIGPFLLLSAQATVAPADTPPQPPPPAHRICRRAPGSDIVVCKPAAQQESYRLNRLPAQAYGPALPNAGSAVGDGVKIRGQATNAGRRHRSGATLSVPF